MFEILRVVLVHDIDNLIEVAHVFPKEEGAVIEVINFDVLFHTLNCVPNILSVNRIRETVLLARKYRDINFLDIFEINNRRRLRVIHLPILLGRPVVIVLEGFVLDELGEVYQLFDARARGEFRARNVDTVVVIEGCLGCHVPVGGAIANEE